MAFLHEVGLRIAHQREKAGVTRKELSERVGIVEYAIGQYENGKTRPSLYRLYQIAEALGTDPRFLLPQALPGAIK